MAKPQIIQTSGSRKRSIARATLKKGKGIIRINSQTLENFSPKFLRMRIEEPLILTPKLASQVDISIKVQGGGMMGQADAARLAIAQALVEFSKDEKVRKQFLDYDRTLLVADVRRKEPRKPNTSKARAMRQKSYR